MGNHPKGIALAALDNASCGCFKFTDMLTKANYSVVMSRESNGRGERHLKIQATVRENKVDFPTNIYVKKDQFKCETIVNHVQASGLNAMLGKYIIDLQSVELEIFRREISLTAQSLYNCYTAHINSKTPLAEFCNFIMKQSSTRRESTKQRYYNTIKQIDNFHHNVCLEDIDVMWLKRFEKHTLAKGNQESTLWSRLKILRTLFNEAIRRDMIRINQNPFRFYEIPELRSRTDVLKFQEIEELELMGLKSYYERHVRDIFCFACYCGLRFGDIRRLTKENIKTVGGVTWLQIHTQKTGSYVQIPISVVFFGNAMRILEKYEDITKLVEYVSNSSINRELKKLMTKAGIGGGQHVTMHTARRSFITGLIDFGVPIVTAQKLAGHSRITTTQKYLQLSTTTVLRDVESAFSKKTTKILHIDIKRDVLRISPTGHKLVVGGEILRCCKCSFYNCRRCKLFKKKKNDDDWCDSFSERLDKEPDHFRSR